MTSMIGPMFPWKSPESAVQRRAQMFEAGLSDALRMYGPDEHVPLADDADGSVVAQGIDLFNALQHRSGNRICAILDGRIVRFQQ